MMRSLIIFVLALSSASAFFSGSAVARKAPIQLTMTLNDEITRAELEAIALTKKFGPKSVEAINAWETFEELSASDNSATSKPGLDEACDTEKLDECADFEARMAELQALIDAGQPVTPEALIEQNKKLFEENQRLRRSLAAYK